MTWWSGDDMMTWTNVHVVVTLYGHLHERKYEYQNICWRRSRIQNPDQSVRSSSSSSHFTWNNFLFFGIQEVNRINLNFNSWICAIHFTSVFTSSSLTFTSLWSRIAAAFWERWLLFSKIWFSLVHCCHQSRSVCTGSPGQLVTQLSHMGRVLESIFKLCFVLLCCTRLLQSYSPTEGCAQHHRIMSLSMSSQQKSRSENRPREFRTLKPLPCVGTYEQDVGNRFSSMFLGFEQMVVQERADGKCVCKGINTTAIWWVHIFFILQ